MDKHNKEVIKRSEEDQKRSTELLDSYRDELYKRQLHDGEVYNKAILCLSSIGLFVISLVLALSLTLMAYRYEGYLFLLVSAWILFSLSISCTVFSFLMSNQAIRVQLENAKQYCIDRNPKVFNKVNTLLRINTALNFSSGILFVAALVPAIIFIISQVNR